MRGLISSALFFGLPVVAHPAAREVAALASPSVVMIVTEDSHHQPLAIGSGFFVKENVIASNAHVVEGAASGYAKIVGQKATFDLQGIVGMDARHDLILLAVEGAKAPALRIDVSRRVAIGDRVYSVGNPKGLEGTFAEGIISGIRDIDGDEILQITAPISPGSSGGPILDDSGAVIGVAAATYKGGQNLNFAIPISQVAKLMVETNAPAPLVARKSENEPKSYISELGRSSRTGVTVVDLKWGIPYDPNYADGLFFVFQNKLSEPVKNCKAEFIFYDKHGEPCDFEIKELSLTIPPGLAKPDSISVDRETAKRSKPSLPEVRILGFEIVERKPDILEK